MIALTVADRETAIRRIIPILDDQGWLPLESIRRQAEEIVDALTEPRRYPVPGSLPKLPQSIFNLETDRRRR